MENIKEEKENSRTNHDKYFILINSIIDKSLKEYEIDDSFHEVPQTYSYISEMGSLNFGKPFMIQNNENNNYFTNQIIKGIINKRNDKSLQHFKTENKESENTRKNGNDESLKKLKIIKRNDSDYLNDKKSNFLTLKSKMKNKLYQLISKFYITKKFIKILRIATNKLFPNNFQLNSLYILDDLSYDKNGWVKPSSYSNFEESKTSNICYYFKNKKIIKWILFFIFKFFFFLKKFLIFTFDKLFIFDPTKNYMNLWDGIHFFVLLFYFVKIPIELSFQINFLQFFLDNFENVQIVERFGISFFIIDLFFNFNTGYYKKGNLILKRKKIAKEYIKTNFLLDLICIFSLFYNTHVNFNDNNSILDILFFVKIKKFFKIFTSIQNSTQINYWYYYIIELLKTILRIVLLSHIFACLWHYIALSLKHKEKTWLSVNNLIDELWWRKYIASYYYVCVTMNTVGYGDITPQNDYELVFTIIFIFFACGMFAYTINVIGIIVQRLRIRKDTLIKNIMIINEYMNKKKIRLDLRIRVRKYLEYMWAEESFHSSEEEISLINKLSTSLKEELLLEANGLTIREIPFLINNFSDNTLKNIAFSIQEIKLTPGEILYLKGDFKNFDLFIVHKGEIELFVEGSNNKKTTILNNFKKGEIFGQYSFFSGKERESSARSSAFTSLYVVNLEKFKNIISDNYNDYQRFCEIKDKINLLNNFDDLIINCDFCKTCSHTPLNCPLLHVNFSKERILAKYNQSSDQKRKKYERNRKKIDCLLKHNYIIKCVKDIQQNLFDEFSELTSNINESEDNTKNKNNPELNLDDNIEEIFKNENFNEMKWISQSQESILSPTFKNNKTNSKESISTFKSKIIKLQSGAELSNNINQSEIIEKLLKKNKITTNQANELIFLKFDSVFVFENYFKHNNHEIIIDKINKKFSDNLKHFKSLFKEKTFKNLRKSFTKRKNDNSLEKASKSYVLHSNPSSQENFKKILLFDKENIKKLLRNKQKKMKHLYLRKFLNYLRRIFCEDD